MMEWWRDGEEVGKEHRSRGRVDEERRNGKGK